MSLLTDEPRSATVVANVATEVLELDRQAFAAILARYPVLLANLNRILTRRLAQRNTRTGDQRRGEAVALVVERVDAGLVARVLAATKAASPGSVAAIDLTRAATAGTVPLAEASVGGALSALDDLLAIHRTVLIVATGDQEELPILLDHVDRAVVLATAVGAGAFASRAGAEAGRADLILWNENGAAGAQTVGPLRVRKTLSREAPDGDVAWLGRHLARTKLGLALGAGGAKGYAHIGALYVLEEAGYTVDYVAGSSIGAMVGAWLALGRTAAEVEASMRQAFTPDNVAAVFKLSMAGTSSGLDAHTRACQETTLHRTFADLRIPLVAMAVDLNTRQPAPVRDGPLWQALLASTALAGLFPPYQRGQQRLVDGLALVPVPTAAVIEEGADVTVSVNLLSRETLPAWPGWSGEAPRPAKVGSRMLETLLEVMDLAQLDSSVRHAALADVALTPRFGPSTWRDFHLADLFLAAGRQAAQEQLPALRALARPQKEVRGQKSEIREEPG
jgi:predicted acylesterase/phospholipase RssA